jgi:hypothetical protein
MRHDPYMHEGETGKAESAATDADRDRYIQVLALEYQAMRSELTMRLSARYQFVGFITGAAALIGAGHSRAGRRSFTNLGFRPAPARTLGNREPGLPIRQGETQAFPTPTSGQLARITRSVLVPDSSLHCTLPAG